MKDISLGISRGEVKMLFLFYLSLPFITNCVVKSNCLGMFRMCEMKALWLSKRLPIVVVSEKLITLVGNESTGGGK